MDHCDGQHGGIIILFLTLNLGLWHCQEAEVSFPPVNLEIHSNLLYQRLFVEWSVSKKPHESDTELMFHIQVARSEKMNVIENVYYKPDLSGRRMMFSWMWESQLPLECDSHSVRIRSSVVANVSASETNWSEWSPWKTHPGQNKERTQAKIYPHERVVLVGSDVTFCCLPGRGQRVQEMSYGPNTMNTSLHVGTDSFVFLVKNVTMTKSSGGNVLCEVEKIRGGPRTVLIVSRLPDEPKNFSCETSDLRTLRCSWIPGPKYNFYKDLEVKYLLQDGSSLKFCERDHCDWPVQEDQQIYNFTLTARNVLGERKVSSIVYLNERVLLLAPSGLRADEVSASLITLTWSLKADYTSRQIHCQVDLQERLVNMTTRGKFSTEIYRVTISGLQPYTQYELRVRCMAESSLAGWSNWSNITVRTPEDAPTGALDVWRQIKDDDEDRTVTLYWKPSSVFRANGNISQYNIKLRPLEGAPEEREISVSGVNSSRLSIGRRAYVISVTAHNKAGGSPPAELKIPANTASHTEQIIVNRTYGKDGGMYISWQQRSGVHGYVVEWCAAPRSPHCDLRWRKYNSTVQDDVIKSPTFRPGVRYDFRIYGSMKDGEQLLEKMEGYTEERVSSMKPKVKISKIEPRSIFLDWSPYPTDGSQEGFVTGYNVYVTDTKSGCNLEKSEGHIQLGDFHMCRIHIGDPNQMHTSISGLKPNGKYEVAVVAITGGGETPPEFNEALTPSDTEAAIRSIIVPVITVSVLALMLLFLGCWNRVWLKRICFPDIPDPNKSKILTFNGTKGALNRNILLTTSHEPQVVDAVSIQENRQQKTHEKANKSPEHQLHEICTKIQTREGSKCDEDVSDTYIPCGNETSMYPATSDPSYISLPLPYLQFFNQTYSSTQPDHIGAQGYTPQTNIAQVPCPPYIVQSVDPESGLDDDTAICLNSSSYGTEPMSPTSVDSTAFIIVD